MSYLPSNILKEFKEAKTYLSLTHPVPTLLVRPLVGDTVFSAIFSGSSLCAIKTG